MFDVKSCSIDGSAGHDCHLVASDSFTQGADLDPEYLLRAGANPNAKDDKVSSHIVCLSVFFVCLLCMFKPA